MSGETIPSISIREGGVVEGTRYYIVAVRDMTGEFSSVALSERATSEFIEEAEDVIDGGVTFRNVTDEEGGSE